MFVSVSETCMVIDCPSVSTDACVTLSLVASGIASGRNPQLQQNESPLLRLNVLKPTLATELKDALKMICNDFFGC